jgi:UDP-3-O-[3-hydroxymyristoyl] glucosamine N-acyltransferase
MVEFTLAELAVHIGAQLENAPPELRVGDIATLIKATGQEVSFYTNHLYRKDLFKTKAAAVILASKDRQYCTVPMLVMNNPYLGYARAAGLFHPNLTKSAGIHPLAYISCNANYPDNISVGAYSVINDGVILGSGVVIGNGCVIENDVEIGDDSQITANVTLCRGSKIGKRVLIHPGAVIGSDGFGLANDHGRWVKVPQLGCVIIADDVEIGANTTIDRGALDDTIIGEGAKLDNQIQVAHNVQIGAHTAIAGCVGIAGSTKIGQYCMIGGGVNIAGHIEIVDNVHITGGSNVHQSILEPGLYSSGIPLDTNRHWHRNYHRFKKLDEMARKLQSLEAQLGRLQEK